MALQSAMYSMYSTSVSEVKKTDTIQVTNYNIYINFINMKNNTLNTKRFVIRKNLIGKGITINFTNKSGKVYTYNHDEVYKANKAKLDSMPCFIKYKSYTATNNVPTFARDFAVSK
jgi:hypothetical protein